MTTTSFQRHRRGWICVCLPIALFIQPACSRVKEEPPAAPPPAVAATEPNTVAAPLQSSPVMVWGGVSYLGYVRVELLAGQSPERPSVQELLVNCSDGSVRRYRGRMIRLPGDLVAARGPWQVFVRTPEDIARTGRSVPEMMASVSPTGVLRLYEFSTSNGDGACDLPPIK